MTAPRTIGIGIGNRRVGDGAPCYIVAEIGINHNGDMALARRSIDAAKLAGADAVKFQNYRTEDFVLDCALTYSYSSQGRAVTEPQYDMFKRCELTPDDVRGLKAYCDSIGIDFHSTPTGEDGVQLLVELGVGVLKNGSDFLGNLPLIEAMGRTGLPTVLSTGMAELADIEAAVSAFRATGNQQLILLHCVSSYPAPAASLNLKKIPELSRTFGCAVGFSDHSEGSLAAVGAVALSACWIEKHFTLDRGLPGPDHRFSSDPADFAALVHAVRGIETALGSAELRPAESEREMRAAARLSCVAARPLGRSHVLATNDIAFMRPGTGLPPKARDTLIGRRLARDVDAGHVFASDDFA
ncbi:MAG: N-acetylneuraminate synthase family protein [Alphaproteobacteria bacterium]